MRIDVDRATAFIAQIQAWAAQKPDIHILVLQGSRARTNNTPADVWSDFDFTVFTDQPATYLDKTAWLAEFGDPQITFLENTMDGFQERRVLYADGVDVDFNIRPVDMIYGLLHNQVPPEQLHDVAAILQHGVRILVDKIGIQAKIDELLALELAPPALPSATTFDNFVQDYWYHVMWVTKKLQRGEVWTAWDCVAGYMGRSMLLRLFTWHSQSQNTGTYTWFNGRFFEQWVDARAQAEFAQAVPHCTAADIKRALRVQMALFRWVAQAVATQLGYVYPQEADTAATTMTAPYLID